jgi:hypothetical protein
MQSTGHSSDLPRFRGHLDARFVQQIDTGFADHVGHELLSLCPARRQTAQAHSPGGSDSVPQPGSTCGRSTVRAAEECPVGLNTVTDDLAAAVFAHWGHPVDRTLEAVENVHDALGVHLEGQVLVVPAYLTHRHHVLLATAEPPPPRQRSPTTPEGRNHGRRAANASARPLSFRRIAAWEVLARPGRRLVAHPRTT